jgi:hypothetical protein
MIAMGMGPVSSWVASSVGVIFSKSQCHPHQCLISTDMSGVRMTKKNEEEEDL